MSALASVDAAELVAVPAPAQTRPVPVHELRPSDRIAFRGAPTQEITDPDDDGPHLVWPRTLPTELPDPAQWCGALVRTCVEVLLGARPPAQLARWLTGDLFGSLSRRAIVGQSQETTARRVRVVRVHTCAVDEARHEASVVFHDGRRIRAAAIRIEVYRGRWRATALEIG
jgi:Family of unknown function (DUF6459)